MIFNQLHILIHLNAIHLAWFEVIFDAMLEPFPFDLHRGQNEGIAKEMSRVPNAFAGAETAKEIIQVLR